MIVKTVQTLVFEYPEDYQAEVEWNKKRDGDWVHQSTDTICSVYTLTNNYLIPTKAKHSFLDNHYFEAEPSNSEIPNNCEHITEDGVTCAKYPACDDCLGNPLNKVKGSEWLLKGKNEPQTEREGE